MTRVAAGGGVKGPGALTPSHAQACGSVAPSEARASENGAQCHERPPAFGTELTNGFSCLARAERRVSFTHEAGAYGAQAEQSSLAQGAPPALVAPGPENDPASANTSLVRKRTPSLKEVHLAELRKRDAAVTRADANYAAFGQLSHEEMANLQRIKDAHELEVKAHNALCPKRYRHRSDAAEGPAKKGKRPEQLDEAARSARTAAESHRWVPIPVEVYQRYADMAAQLSAGIRDGCRVESVDSLRAIHSRMDAAMRAAWVETAERVARGGAAERKHEGMVFQGSIFTLLEQEGEHSAAAIAAENGVCEGFIRSLAAKLWYTYWDQNRHPRPLRDAPNSINFPAIADQEVLTNANTGGATLWRCLKAVRKNNKKYAHVPTLLTLFVRV